MLALPGNPQEQLLTTKLYPSAFHSKDRTQVWKIIRDRQQRKTVSKVAAGRSRIELRRASKLVNE
uniref:Uncharacterized protein n=1 Tax=Megaselia scalaris TaxID=36166 RepID=T1GPC4_MEGSC